MYQDVFVKTTAEEQVKIIGEQTSKTMPLGGSLHVIGLHMVEKCATNWHDVLFAPLFCKAAGLTMAPIKLHVRTNKMLQEILHADCSLENLSSMISKICGKYVDYEHTHKERSRTDDDIASKDNADADSGDKGNGSEDDDGDYGGAEITGRSAFGPCSVYTHDFRHGLCRYYFRCDKKLQRLLKQ